jgi:uncharacterized protein (TIGR00725 family)
MNDVNAPSPPPPRIAVIGPSQATEAQLDAAERCGRLLAEAGAVLVTGGLGGVMAAASRGAASAGGLTVGILPSRDAATANPWVALPIATGLGEMRNALVVASAQAVLAVGLSWGTLSEVALAMAGGRPVVALDVAPLPLDGVVHSDTPEKAVRDVLARVRQAG